MAERDQPASHGHLSVAELKGGAKLKAYLSTMAKQLAKKDEVDVGFLPEATYPDDVPVAYIAAIQEYGGTWQIPAHQVEVFRRLKKNGEFARGGRFVKKAQANIVTTHDVADYTVTIPPRPFFRTMIAKNSPSWGPALGALLVASNFDSAKALSQIGDEMAGQLQDSIRDFTDPPNAPSTIRKKGFNKPLIDTGTMLRSVDKAIR